MTDQPQSLLLSSLNLIEAQDWSDLLSDEDFSQRGAEVMLAPYQTVWVTNIRDHGTTSPDVAGLP